MGQPGMPMMPQPGFPMMGMPHVGQPGMPGIMMGQLPGVLPMGQQLSGVPPQAESPWAGGSPSTPHSGLPGTPLAMSGQPGMPGTPLAMSNQPGKQPDTPGSGIHSAA